MGALGAGNSNNNAPLNGTYTYKPPKPLGPVAQTPSRSIVGPLIGGNKFFVTGSGVGRVTPTPTPVPTVDSSLWRDPVRSVQAPNYYGTSGAPNSGSASLGSASTALAGGGGSPSAALFGGGGTSSFTAGAGVGAPVDPGVPPVIPDASADSTYQQQVADLQKALSDYQAQQALSLSQYGQNYNEGLRNLGWNSGNNAFDPNNMQGLYGQAQDTNTNDFGARGLLRSGLYAQALGNINTDFTGRKTNLDTSKQQYTDSSSLAMTDFKGKSDLAKQSAMREAVARIAAQYGVLPSQVPGQTVTA